MATGDGYMTRPHLIISSGILDVHIQLVVQLPKLIIVLIWHIIWVVNGVMVYVGMPSRIYVKVIFVSLLFDFVANIVDFKNKMKKNKKQNKTT